MATPVAPDTSTGWTLNECIYRLDGVSPLGIDHRMLVVADPQDNMVAQINALASIWDGHRGIWQPVPIGYQKKHRLRLYISGYWRFRNGNLETYREAPELHGALRVFGTDGRIRSSLSGARARGLVELVAGQGGNQSEQSLMALMARAIVAAKRLNAVGNKDPRAKGLSYPKLGLGPNSNSFIHTLRAAMGFAPAATDFGGNAPYYKVTLLDSAELADISLDDIVTPQKDDV